MKSKIKFEIHLSTNDVHFLDVTLYLKHGILRTTSFTKPTDSHVYLNTLSCHPWYVLKIYPKDSLFDCDVYVHKKSDYLLHFNVAPCGKYKIHH